MVSTSELQRSCGPFRGKPSGRRFSRRWSSRVWYDPQTTSPLTKEVHWPPTHEERRSRTWHVAGMMPCTCIPPFRHGPGVPLPHSRVARSVLTHTIARHMLHRRTRPSAHERYRERVPQCRLAYIAANPTTSGSSTYDGATGTSSVSGGRSNVRGSTVGSDTTSRLHRGGSNAPPFNGFRPAIC